MAGRGLYAVPVFAPPRERWLRRRGPLRSNPRRMRPNAASIADAPDEEPASSDSGCMCSLSQPASAGSRNRSGREKQRCRPAIQYLSSPTQPPANIQRARPDLGHTRAPCNLSPAFVLGTGAGLIGLKIPRQVSRSGAAKEYRGAEECSLRLWDLCNNQFFFRQSHNAERIFGSPVARDNM